MKFDWESLLLKVDINSKLNYSCNYLMSAFDHFVPLHIPYKYKKLDPQITYEVKNLMKEYDNMLRLAKRTRNPLFQTEFCRLRVFLQTKLSNASNKYNYNY